MRPLTNTDVRVERNVRLHQFPHVVLQPPGKTDLGHRQKSRGIFGGTLGTFAGPAKAAPRPPKRDAPIPGDPKGSTRQPDSGAEEREVWLLPHVRRPGEGESPGLLRGLERTGRRSPSVLLLGLDPPASQALFRCRRRGKAHPRPPRWTFASSRGRLTPP